MSNNLEDVDVEAELSRREKRKAFYEKNRERILNEKKEYHKQNKEARASYQRRYYAENAEALKQYQKARRQNGVSDRKASRYAEDAEYRERAKEAARRWRDANKARAQELKDKHAANPAFKLWSTAKNRALKAGVEFNIELSDVVVPATCPILGIPLVVQSGKVGSNSPSLDRIHPDKGYTKGNVQVISYRANSMKSNATPQDLLRFAHWTTTFFGLFGVQQELEIKRSGKTGI